MYSNHPAFLAPSHNCTIWRYCDFTKLLSLLEDRQLFLARADQFEDPYEGVFPRRSLEMLRDPSHNGGMDPADAESYYAAVTADAAKFKMRAFLNCWFMAEHESAAMWKLYLQSSEGVAIRSDCDSLVRELESSPLETHLGQVQYIDYELEALPKGYMFYVVTHKRLSFAHESELRVVVWSGEQANQSQIAEDSMFVKIKVQPERLVHAIHVAPTAPNWFGRLVETVVRRYGLTCPVVYSNLYERPTY